MYNFNKKLLQMLQTLLFKKDDWLIKLIWEDVLRRTLFNPNNQN